MRNLTPVFIGLVVLFMGVSQARTITETQQNIHQLDHKIKQIQQNLSQTHDKQTQLKRALTKTEQDIKQNVDKLATIETQLTHKKTEITKIEQSIETLNQQFKALQAVLNKHIQARYKHPKNQPLAWLFINSKQHNTDKLLTYYQYLIRAHQKTIHQLTVTHTALLEQKKSLRHELEALQTLQTEWQTQQQQLLKLKQQHTALLLALSQTLQTQQKTLTIAKQNRDNLTKILRTLNQQSVIQTRHSMTRMKSKLPLPVNANFEQIHTLNQGIILYNPEGSPVHAIFPGKIVFSEWLNGYGLLLIIDHGWGLMTLYANNLALMKQKGDTVMQGEQIATVGHSGTLKQPGLYFEVRQRGKAIPPLDWLGIKK